VLQGFEGIGIFGRLMPISDTGFGIVPLRLKFKVLNIILSRKINVVTLIFIAVFFVEFLVVGSKIGPPWKDGLSGDNP